MKIDLQSHSTVSDGELGPAAVVEAAAAGGVEVLALTDHDAIDGVPEASEAAIVAGIELIPAVEFSSLHQKFGDLHIVGYWLKPEDGALQAVLKRAQDDRRLRARKIVQSLEDQGIHLSLEDAVNYAGSAIALGRPHIAATALKDPRNTEILAGVDDISEFIPRYLVPGKPAFVSRSWPSSEEIVGLIKDFGGSAVWAHPFWDLDGEKDVALLLDQLQAIGLDGVEVFYPSHSREQTAYLVEECRKRQLAMTASADFHGPNHRLFSRFLSYQTYGLGEPELPPRR